MGKVACYIGAVFFVLMIPTIAMGQQGAPPTPALTYEAAKQAAEAAEAEARRNEWNVTILVVDSAGVPVYLKRMTGASPRSVDFAMGKARTSAASGLPTVEYARRVADGSLQAIPEAVAIEGGIPISIDGRVVGAISASGVRPNQDAQVAQAGADAFGG